MTTRTVPRRPVAEDLAAILASPEIGDLIDRLQSTRETGRPGYSLRSMVGMALAKSLYALPTWTRTVRLVGEHRELAAVIAPGGPVPSVFACYRFTTKLREHAAILEDCIASVIRSLKQRNPLLGWDVAIDASDMPAYANGQRFVSKGGRKRSDDEFSDPDASWGHRSAVSTRKGGGFYGYRLHMAVCSKTDLPLAWTVETAKANESRRSDLYSPSSRRTGSPLRRVRWTRAMTLRRPTEVVRKSVDFWVAVLLPRPLPLAAFWVLEVHPRQEEPP
jgi:hypothetical protein